MRYILSSCLAFCCLLSLPLAATELQLRQAEIRAPLPGRTVTAGYFELQNTSAQTIEVVGARSPAFARIELHQHIEHEGMMRMVEVESIEVAPGATLRFQPGGLHLMLFTPQQPISVGDTVPLSLLFLDGSELLLEFPIVAMPRR